MRDSLEDQIRNETILVTGATGFTGGHLARCLRKCRASVRVLVRPGSRNRELGHCCEFAVVEGDLEKKDDVLRAAHGVDRIFHIAAAYRNAKHPDSYFHRINVGGTTNIIAAAREHGVMRTIHCSTAGVHGEVHNIPATESSSFNPGDIYQRTKLEAEQCFSEAMQDGLPGVIFRPVGIYGPGDLRFLKLFKTIQQRQFRMFGSGDVLYHLTYIDDLIHGILLCGYHPAAEGETYLLAGPRYTTLNELVMLVADAVGAPPPQGHLPMWPLVMAAAGCEGICRAVGVEPPLHRRRIEFFRKDRAFSIEKAQRELGFQPHVDLCEGLTRTAKWYVAQGYLRRGHAHHTAHSRA